MAISKCISLSYENKIDSAASEAALYINETGHHGTPEFPVAIYLDDVSYRYVNWHWHEEFEVGFVTEGAVILGSGNRIYELKSGDVFFVNSNVLHSMRNKAPSQSAIFKSIAFHSTLISDHRESVFYKKYLLPILLDSNLKDCVIKEEHACYNRIYSLLNNLWNILSQEPEDYEIQVRNELSNLFSTLKQFQKTMAEHPLRNGKDDLPEKRVQLLLDFIHSNFKRKITIEDLARSASVSKTEVLRCFKSIIGVSPIHYLNSYRLQRAAALLLDTKKSISEIAIDCGFEDNSYFSKQFKKKYQLTPQEYRGK